MPEHTIPGTWIERHTLAGEWTPFHVVPGQWVGEATATTASAWPAASVEVTAYAPASAFDRTSLWPAAFIEVTANAPGTSVGVTSAWPVASVEVTANVPSTLINYASSWPVASVEVAANAPTTVITYASFWPAASVEVTASAPTTALGGASDWPTAGISVTAYAPSTGSNISSNWPVASVEVTGFAPSTNVVTASAWPVASLDVTANAPTTSLTIASFWPVAETEISAFAPDSQPDALTSGQWTVATGSGDAELDFSIVTAPDSDATITSYLYTTDGGTTTATLPGGTATGTTRTVSTLSAGGSISSGQVFTSQLAVYAVSSVGTSLISDTKTATAGAASALDEVTFSGSQYYTNTGSGSAGWDLGFSSSIDGMSGYIYLNANASSPPETLLFMQDRFAADITTSGVFTVNTSVSGGSANIVGTTTLTSSGATEIWFAMDFANGANELYVDGVDDLSGSSTNTYSANVDMTPGNDYQTENLGSSFAGSTYNGTLTRLCVWETTLDITDSAVRADMADEAETANLGTAPVDMWGTLSEWNANNANNGTGGQFGSMTGTLT